MAELTLPSDRRDWPLRAQSRTFNVNCDALRSGHSTPGGVIGHCKHARTEHKPDFETALLETMHHHARFMARTAEAPGWTSQFRKLILDIAADLHDLRSGAAAFAPALDPDSYDAAQALAASLQAGGSESLIYPSQRDPGGQCVGLFYPDRAANLLQGRHLDYHWDGARVDFYRDAGSGSVYRVN